MAIQRIFASAVLCGFLIGCSGEQSNSTGHTVVHEVNRYQFVELEVVGRPNDETEFNHYYMGDTDGFHHLTVRGKRYKIPMGQLKFEHPFPYTDKKEGWLQMRVHFSHIELPDGTFISLL